MSANIISGLVSYLVVILPLNQARQHWYRQRYSADAAWLDSALAE
jgi:hypothetical protein